MCMTAVTVEAGTTTLILQAARIVLQGIYTLKDAQIAAIPIPPILACPVAVCAADSIVLALGQQLLLCMRHKDTSRFAIAQIAVNKNIGIQATGLVVHAMAMIIKRLQT